jgi:hypothetical protein
MMQSKFDKFRTTRRVEILSAIDFLEALKHTMPLSTFKSLRWELFQELEDIDNRDVIQFSHIKLLKNSPSYWR